MSDLNHKNANFMYIIYENADAIVKSLDSNHTMSVGKLALILGMDVNLTWQYLLDCVPIYKENINVMLDGTTVWVNPSIKQNRMIL